MPRKYIEKKWDLDDDRDFDSITGGKHKHNRNRSGQGQTHYKDERSIKVKVKNGPASEEAVVVADKQKGGAGGGGGGGRVFTLSKKEKNQSRRDDNAKWKQSVRKLSTGNYLEVDPSSLQDPNPRHSLYYQTQLYSLFQPFDDDDSNGNDNGRGNVNDVEKEEDEEENSVKREVKGKGEGQNTMQQQRTVKKGTWKSFQQALSTPMPVTFRSSGSCPAIVNQNMARLMNNNNTSGSFANMKGRFVEVDGRVLKSDIVRKLPWFEVEGAAGNNNTSNQNHHHPVVYQCAVGANTLSHNRGLAPLSSYLHREVTLGNIIRQELASMLPACLLDLQSHHIVLDVCAAPGSKTEQLLSTMTAHASSTISSSTARQGHENGHGYRRVSIPTGMVVANDADTKRIHTLKERLTSRAGVPHLMLMNHRAEDLQRLLATYKRRRIREFRNNYKSNSKDNSIITANNALHSIEIGGCGFFDRIVADVPCSGDGTIRKFPHIWRLFRPRMSLELHNIQLQIAIASVLMLKPGGKMIYSTCSLNPIENEAVVCALLRYFNVQGGCKNVHNENCSIGGGVRLYQTQYGNSINPCAKNYSLRLVDSIPTVLPRIIAHEGLEAWKCDEDTFVNRATETNDSDYIKSLHMLPTINSATMFPPKDEMEARNMKLTRCRRVLPHDMDSGGFFVAVLELIEIGNGSHDGYGIPDMNDMNDMNSSALQAVSGFHSVHVMTKLGYNPTVAGVTDDNADVSSKKKSKYSDKIKRKSDTDAAAAAALTNMDHQLTFRPLTPEQENTVERRLQLDLSQSHTHHTNANSTNTNNATANASGNDSENASAHFIEVTSIFIAPVLQQEEKDQEKERQLRCKRQRSEQLLNQGCIFGSKAQGWQTGNKNGNNDSDGNDIIESNEQDNNDKSNGESIVQSISLVSNAVKQALQSWAAPIAHVAVTSNKEDTGRGKEGRGGGGGGRGGGGGANVSIVHVGVNVSFIITPKLPLSLPRPLPTSAAADYLDKEFRLDAAAVRAVYPLLSSYPAANIVKLNASDFRYFAKLGCFDLSTAAMAAATVAVRSSAGASKEDNKGAGAGGADEEANMDIDVEAEAEKERQEEERDSRLQDLLDLLLEEDDDDEGDVKEPGSVISKNGKYAIQQWFNALYESQVQQQQHTSEVKYLFLELKENTVSLPFSTDTIDTVGFDGEGKSGSNGRRRLSKAERKRLINISESSSMNASSVANMAISSVNACNSASNSVEWSGGPAVLALQFILISDNNDNDDDDEDNEDIALTPVFAWVSESDMCESLYSAL